MKADITQEGSVPESAPTTEPTEAAPQRDPLADAGIVPDIPAEPSPMPNASSGGTTSSPAPAPQGSANPPGNDSPAP